MDSTGAARKGWMGLMARSSEGRVTELLSLFGAPVDVFWLRRAEIGSVMVRGRTGGTGAAFNLGEMTVTRATVQLACGSVGHGYVQGRRKSDAEAAAVVDAVMQTSIAAKADAAILAPLRAEEEAYRTNRAKKAAATKVEFFTMVRGES